MLIANALLASVIASICLVSISLYRMSLVKSSKIWSLQGGMSIFDQFHGLRFLPSDDRQYCMTLATFNSEQYTKPIIM